jgi:hypothetical protein
LEIASPGDPTALVPVECYLLELAFTCAPNPVGVKLLAAVGLREALGGCFILGFADPLQCLSVAPLAHRWLGAFLRTTRDLFPTEVNKQNGSKAGLMYSSPIVSARFLSVYDFSISFQLYHFSCLTGSFLLPAIGPFFQFIISAFRFQLLAFRSTSYLLFLSSSSYWHVLATHQAALISRVMAEMSPDDFGTVSLFLRLGVRLLTLAALPSPLSLEHLLLTHVV